MYEYLIEKSSNDNFCSTVSFGTIFVCALNTFKSSEVYRRAQKEFEKYVDSIYGCRQILGGGELENLLTNVRLSCLNILLRIALELCASVLKYKLRDI
jgi:hypothetical protein